MRKNLRKYPFPLPLLIVPFPLSCHRPRAIGAATIVCSLTIMPASLENTKVRSTSNQLTFKRSTVMGTKSLPTGKSRLPRLRWLGRNETKKSGGRKGGREGGRWWKTGTGAPDSPACSGLHTINWENISPAVLTRKGNVVRGGGEGRQGRPGPRRG